MTTTFRIHCGGVKPSPGQVGQASDITSGRKRPVCAVITEGFWWGYAWAIFLLSVQAVTLVSCSFSWCVVSQHFSEEDLRGGEDDDVVHTSGSLTPFTLWLQQLFLLKETLINHVVYKMLVVISQSFHWYLFSRICFFPAVIFVAAKMIIHTP